MGNDVPENIYEEMEALVEDRVITRSQSLVMMGPHPKVNEIYGSLLRAGNITVIVARSGVGKTQFCMITLPRLVFSMMSLFFTSTMVK